MITLLTEMTTSYERASLAERYRVLPFLLSTVNKILSKSSPRSGPDASSDTSNSASTLAAIQCFYSSLKGLTTVDLYVPPSAKTGNDQSSSAAAGEALGDRNDSNRSDSDSKISHSHSSQNNSQNSSSSSSKESQKQSDSTPFSFSEYLNSPAVTEGVEQFVRNKEAVSRTIFLLTICMESVKNREVQNRMSQGSRSVVVYKESRGSNKNSDSNENDDDDDDDDDVDDENDDNGDDDCQDNEELDKDKQKQQQKHNNSTNNGTNNIDAQYPMRRQLNGDDDAIICTAFEALRTAQILWSLSDDIEKIKKISNKVSNKGSNRSSNKAVSKLLNESSNTSSNSRSNSSINSSMNQENKDNVRVVESDKSIDNKSDNRIDHETPFLKPFSSIFLAQLVQFALFFGAQR